MNKLFEGSSYDDLIYWRFVNLKNLDKINELLKSIERDGPLKGIGKPEKLKGRNGVYSRRINEEHRLIYRYSPNLITIISCKGHYE